MSDKFREDLISYFRYFADHHALNVSKLYAGFAHVIADSDELLNIAAQGTFGQPAANLLLAAVHYLLAGPYADEELASYYDTLGGSRAYDDGNPGALFSQFVLAHEEEILALISTGITNTNEIGRCSVLVPGLMMVGREANAPLHLIEIGPSCGLNLAWDKYGYTYGSEYCGDPEAPLKLSTEVRGDQPPLDKNFPEVASRVGLDLYPVDIADPKTLAWQLALIWPGNVGRVERLKTAFKIAQSTKPQIIAGDAVETLRQAVESLPSTGAVCVYHSIATYQIPPDRRAMLSEVLTDLGKQRPIWRVGMEWIDDGARGLKNGDISLGMGRYTGGNLSYQNLAFCDPHGRWIDWAPQEPQATDAI